MFVIFLTSLDHRISDDLKTPINRFSFTILIGKSNFVLTLEPIDIISSLLLLLYGSSDNCVSIGGGNVYLFQLLDRVNVQPIFLTLYLFLILIRPLIYVKLTLSSYS